MKLALIGSYGHVNMVLDSITSRPDVELVAASRWGPGDPLPYVGAHGSASDSMHVYGDYRKMLAEEEELDIVGVFMPLYRNAEASLAAVSRGCHVISEKPLATNMGDLTALRDAIKQAGVHVAGLFSARGEGPFIAVRNAVLSGRIGTPVLVSAQKSYPFSRRDDFYKQRETYGGSIPWQAIHAIDFIRYTTGKDYARITAMQSNAAHPAYPGMEDNGAVLAELVGGGHATITFDYLRPWRGDSTRNWGDDRLRIAGTEGIVEVTDEGKSAVLLTASAREQLPIPPNRDLFCEFVDMVNGAGEGLVSTEESLRATEVALKARDAADAGEIVRL